jgi:hypothetical protein
MGHRASEGDCTSHGFHRGFPFKFQARFCTRCPIKALPSTEST